MDGDARSERMLRTHIRCRRMRVDEYDVVIFPGLNQRLHASFRQ